MTAIETTLNGSALEAYRSFEKKLVPPFVLRILGIPNLKPRAPGGDPILLVVVLVQFKTIRFGREYAVGLD
jgi:hypothetical protein